MAKIYTASIDISYHIKNTRRVLNKLSDFSSSWSQGTMWIGHWCEDRHMTKKQYRENLKKLERDLSFLELRHSESEDERKAYREVNGDASFEWLLRAVYEESKKKESVSFFTIESVIQEHYSLPIRSASMSDLVWG